MVDQHFEIYGRISGLSDPWSNSSTPVMKKQAEHIRQFENVKEDSESSSSSSSSVSIANDSREILKT